MKMRFYGTVGKTKSFLDNFNTLFIHFGGILNSRPLTAPLVDSIDPLALTPAHSLIGRPLTALPVPSLQDDRTLSRKFKAIKIIVKQFWKKAKDYMTTLQQRPNWHDYKPQYGVNDIVIIIEDNTPPLLW